MKNRFISKDPMAQSLILDLCPVAQSVVLATQSLAMTSKVRFAGPYFCVECDGVVCNRHEPMSQ